MISDTIESSAAAAPKADQPKAKRKPGRKAKDAKKQAAKKSMAERANKKADVIALMKRGKGATLAEIMKAAGSQPHTVRGFVSILGSKGGAKIESSKSADGERTHKIK